MTERISFLRQRAQNTRPLKQTNKKNSDSDSQKQSPVMALAGEITHRYDHRPVIIQDAELIVGGDPRQDIEAPVTSKIAGRRSWSSGPVWNIPEQYKKFFHSGVFSWAGNHNTLDYDLAFSLGLSGIRSQIASGISEMELTEPNNVKKLDYLKALDLVAGSYVAFAERHGEHADTLAETATDLASTGISQSERVNELREISRICRKVPSRPPETFWEACQCAWFLFLLVPDAPGRLDQYLFPFYRNDLKRGIIDRDFARELLSCLWMKYFEYAGVEDGVSARNHLTLAGLTPQGQDAVNEVTYLCLEVIEELALSRPQVGFRWNSKTPRNALERAVEVLKTNTGNPDFCNDEVIVPALQRIGVDMADAKNFSLSGCHEVIVTGMSQMGSVEGFVNMAKVGRMAMGLEPQLYRCPDLQDIDTFEKLWTQIEGAMDVVAATAHEVSVCRDRQTAEVLEKNLEVSLVTRDCIRNGKDYTQGGARYNFCNWNLIGIANLADSLHTLQALVFDTQLVGLAELRKALESDWQNYEPLRTRIVGDLPRYGNDDDGPDAIAVALIKSYSRILKNYTPYRGGEYILGTTAGAENMHAEFGEVTGATADGRLGGDPLADSIGPAQGRDKKGITAVLNSVAKLPHDLLPTATTLNVKLDQQVLQNREGIGRVVSLIEGHFNSGGQQIQFNFHDRDILEDAKRHPELHGGLMVRVAGYSAPFVSLWENLQDEIIARTAHHV